MTWKVQIFGEKCGQSYEITVVHSGDILGQKSFGWVSDTKLLVLHNGGPCEWPVCEDVWDSAVDTAERLALRLNSLGVDKWPVTQKERS